VHKAGVAGREGPDLGEELEEALGAEGQPSSPSSSNTVDDALVKGRQSIDPAGRPEDIGELPQMLDRAAAAGRTGVLTSERARPRARQRVPSAAGRQRAVASRRRRTGRRRGGCRGSPHAGAGWPGDPRRHRAAALRRPGPATTVARRWPRSPSPWWCSYLQVSKCPRGWLELPPAATAWWPGDTPVVAPSPRFTPKATRTSFAMSAKVVKNESSLALARRDQRAYGP
jgi:hypothetical protein